MQGPLRRRWHGAWCCGPRVSDRYHCQAPLCAACVEVDLDAAAVDEQTVEDIIGHGHLAEDVLPDIAFGPAHEAPFDKLRTGL